MLSITLQPDEGVNSIFGRADLLAKERRRLMDLTREAFPEGKDNWKRAQLLELEQTVFCKYTGYDIAEERMVTILNNPMMYYLECRK